jgi:hypothetical protein
MGYPLVTRTMKPLTNVTGTEVEAMEKRKTKLIIDLSRSFNCIAQLYWLEHKQQY